MSTIDRLIRARTEFLRRCPRSADERRAYDWGATNSLYEAGEDILAEQYEQRIRETDEVANEKGKSK